MARALAWATPRFPGLLAVLLACGASVSASAGSPASSTITQTPFGETPAGIPVNLYTLRNRAGMEARISNYGGIVTSLTAPDRHGCYADVVLGYDTLEQYLKASPYFGALIGRYGNRIAQGRFALNGFVYTITTNDGPNSLHGGKVGFDKVVWKVVKVEVTAQGPQLALTYLSRDGEEGYPGNLAVTAVYTLTEDNALRLEYRATTDRDTVVNLTQHSYFNLRGRGDVLGHIVQIHADRFTPVDSTLIPTGELRSVRGTPFDFRKPAAIGARIEQSDEQLRFAKGYDHNWVLDTPPGELAMDATAYEPETGRVLEVSSTQPGLQFYSGNFLDGSIVGKGGERYAIRSGFCMEPQHFPDSPNYPAFPSTVLKPGQVYGNTIVYRFTTRGRSAKVDSGNQYDKTLETTEGPIQGALTPTTITYLGIPYAEPPVGDLRWRPPEPHRPWHSVLDATRFGHHCLQATAHSKQRNASEDCLFLNIYVPRKRRLGRDAHLLTPWPVMVWIHGGANAGGASDEYDPTPLVQAGDGVVVVTLNYRLGPFGFLAHSALDAEGHAAVNYGILDQQLALRWVRANIGRFGGDAHNVTIFGESSGGLNVAIHLASPLAAGLFDKAIIQSGAYQLDTPSLGESEKLGRAFADRAGCTDQMATCLRALSAAAVLAQAGEVNTPEAAYQSTVDGQILLESQRKALEEGRIHRVPVLQGNNSDEGRQLRTLTRDEYRSAVQSVAKALRRDPDQALGVYSLRRYSSPTAAVSAAAGDFIFACSAQASNRSLSKWVPTYAYEFSDKALGAYGSIHGAEQRYLFNVKHDPGDFNIDSADAEKRAEFAATESLDGGPATLPAPSRRLSEAMRLSWTAFARSGNPSTAVTRGWPRASKGVEILKPSLPGAVTSSDLRARHHCAFLDPLRASD